MHNSGSWAHRSPVAVAGKVTQVIEQTNNRKKKEAPLKLRLTQSTPSLWLGTTFLQDQRGNVPKSTNRASNYPYPLLLSLQLQRDLEVLRTYKNRYFTVGQWKLHLFRVDLSRLSNVLWPHTSVCAYKWHSKVCMDGPCSYSRSLVSKGC